MTDQVYEFKNVTDILVLDGEQFKRFIEDFKEWFVFQKQARADVEKLKAMGINITLVDVIRWKDDNVVGLGEININVIKTKS